MCFGGGGDNGAGAAREQTAMMEAQQKRHDDAVASGKSSIDTAFSQFDDPYFKKYTDTYVNTYNPQLDDQYARAKDKMYSALAGNDQLGGSAGNNSLALLDKTYGDTRTDIANKAADATNSFRTSVDNTKSNLYALNSSAADPDTMARQAQAEAGTIVSPQSYPTLSNVFGDALGSVATYQKANSGSMNANSPLSNWFAPVGGSGSAVYG